MRFSTFKNKAVAMLLSVVTLLSIAAVPAQAASISDSGSKTVTIKMGTRHSYLETTSGTALGGEAWTYTTDNNITGPAYCINWGLKSAPSTKALPITGIFTNNPKTIGAFSGGYPQRSLEDFMTINASVSELAGLTEDEYAYATQVAVWASLGQLAVEGTSFTAGRATLAKPTGDAQQIRTFAALTIILNNANHWTKPLKTGMAVRSEKDALRNVVDIQLRDGMVEAAKNNVNGIRKETINGVEYYTRIFYATSMTSTWKNGYFIDVWPTGAPSGTIITNESNVFLATEVENGNTVYKVPVTARNTPINENGSEYIGSFKLCMPVLTTPADGSVIINSSSIITQYNVYQAYNSEETEQSYVIADPLYAPMTAKGTLTWATKQSIYGKLLVEKVDGSGIPLSGASFKLEGGGKSYTGTSDANGLIEWDELDPSIQYTLTETSAPAGFTLAAPVNVTVIAGQTVTVTVKNESEHSFRLRKIDAQNSFPLGQAVFRFEQIDGSYVTTAATGQDGYIEFVGGALPYGSYRVSEQQSPAGYLKDTSIQTVHWTGRDDVLLTFRDVRKPTIVLIKKDEATSETLEGAVFNVYKDGKLITTVTTNRAGEARVLDVTPGYWEFEETSVPSTHILDSTRHGIYVNIYDPSTTNDPVLVVTNKAKPSLKILKYDQQSGKPVSATFEVYRDTALIGTYATNSAGEILLTGLTPGTYLVKEISTDSAHVVNTTPQQIEIKAGSGVSQLIFYNPLKPGVKILKVDASDMKPLAGAVFVVTKVGGSFQKEFTTTANGEIDLTSLEPGAYQIYEKQAPSSYLTDDNIRTVQINPDENAVFVFTNTKKPTLIVWKYDEQTAKPLPDTEFSVSKKDGTVIYEGVTGSGGFIRLDNLDEGWVTVTEMAPPPHYLLSSPVSRDVYLVAGKVMEIKFDNLKCPTLTINKLDSVTRDPIPGVKFNIKFSPAANFTGGVVDLGTFTTDSAGRIVLDNDLQSGFYRCTEIEPAPGYTLKEPVTQDIFLKGGDNKTLVFENVPKSALIIRKVDTSTGLPVAGATFEIKYLAGTSGSGGTLIKTAVTSVNGTIVLTGLLPGTYVCSETVPAKGYQLSNPSVQTAYISGKEQDAVELVFGNPKMGHLVITKLDSVTKLPVAGVTFLVTDSSGAVIGPNNGEYTTDASGVIEITEYLPIGSTVNVKEIRCPDTHNMDAAPQSVKIMENTTHRLTFYDSPKSGLQIVKIDAATKQPLAHAFFSVYKKSGDLIGEYETNAEGIIILDKLSPDWIKIVETRSPDGYLLDETPKDVEITSNQFVKVVFENRPLSGILIIKTDANTGKPLEGVKFEVCKANGERVGLYTTNGSGRIYINDIPDGKYEIFEREALKGYKLDTKAYPVTVRAGRQEVVEIKNKPLAGLRLIKIDSITKKPIYNVEFMVFDFYTNRQVGTFYTDNNGLIDFAGILTEGRYTIRETRPAANYYPDDMPRTVEFRAGQVTEVRWENTPKLGQIQILKKSGDNNEVNGLPAGTPLAGAVFEVYEYKSRNLVDRFTSGADGKAVSKPLPLGRYLVKEVQSPKWYKLSTQTLDIEIEFATQIIKQEFFNYSANTGVNIKKTGPLECMPGDIIRYDIKAVQNTSTVPLTDFYWRDTLSTDAVRLTKIVTGTYNQALKYKVMITTNKGDTRVIADNLSTTKNNVIGCSNAELGLRNDEYVTSFTLIFGTVKAGFAQVEQPQVYVKVLTTLPNGYQFANKADVGGKYGNEWVVGNSTCLTTIYKKPEKLPRTGY